MPNTGFYEKFPSDWENTANNFTIVEHHVIRSLEGMKTALSARAIPSWSAVKAIRFATAG
jgi:hypothetical protein